MWSSDSETVATVDDSGLVTAIAKGEAGITVRTADGNHTAVCTVTVSEPTGTHFIPEKSIKVYPTITGGILHVETDKATALQIIHISGAVMERVTPDTPTCVLNISHYPAGIYFIKTNDCQVIKIYKQ
jgi:uncharacterized protein YjdB